MIKKKDEGFTLVEFLIYSVLITMIVGLLVLMSTNILGARGRVIAMEAISYDARFVLGRITYEIRRAEQIISPLSGSSGSFLELTGSDGDSLVFRLDEQEEKVLQMIIGEGNPISLTSESIIVKDLQFSNVSYQNSPGAVRITMTLEFDNPLERPEWNFQRTFYTTENLRR